MKIHIKQVLQPDNQHLYNKWHSTIYNLDRAAFPGDYAVETERCHAWLAFADKQPVGFICVDTVGAYVKVQRYGVLANYRGQGIGKRLLRTCEKFARARKAIGVITYTTHDNSNSINALIKVGYRAYTSRPPYAGKEFVYWLKQL